MTDVDMDSDSTIELVERFGNKILEKGSFTTM